MIHGQKRAELLQLVRLQRNADASYNELISQFKFTPDEIEEEKIRLSTPVSPRQHY